MTKKIYALVDCNNFYVSCERVFNGNLENKPVAVLSNNDGCFIARSNEVKALGIPMGAPLYQWQDLVDKEGIIVFSANFPLYGDMSHRVMKTLEEMCPDLEIYSIDEAFLDLTNMHLSSVTDYCRLIKETVERWTGIPVSVGVGPTKTLAKAASKLAKKIKSNNGVFNFLDYPDTKENDEYLSKVEVGDVWGIGRKYTKLLNRYNIINACDLKNADPVFIKQRLTVTGERTQMELSGIACIPVNRNPHPKKAIAVTRSFGKYQKTLQELSESVAYFTRKIGEKLRAQESAANYLQVFILTNLHRKDHPQYHNSVIVKLAKPSDYSPLLIAAALQGLKNIFRTGFSYKKAGVLALALQPKDLIQYSFLEPTPETQKNAEAKLMKTVDGINRRVGADVLKYAAEGVTRGWWMNQTHKSKRYTTKWAEILQAKLT